MRPLRLKDGTKFRLITIRTVRAELWLTPSSNMAKIIGGILARYQEFCAVELYAYCVLGNHMHLLVRAPKENLDEYFENVNREISRRVNWKHKREGSLWGRRYDAHEVLSEDDLLEAFLYVTTNPTRHGLLRHSLNWKGLNSYKQSLNGKDRRFSFYHYSQIQEGGKPLVTTHGLTLTPLPQYASLSQKKRGTELKQLLTERENQIAEERESKGQGFAGMELISDEFVPGERPRNVSRSRRPACYTKCAELRRQFKEMMRALRDKYNEASALFRFGDRSVEFPEHTYLPPLHRKPRLVPFMELNSLSDLA